ncbi:hypothetical protein PWT90_05898 [Aphanocladium album]|nr:hypothetical protein PWT90_05898 [Aphanocladium album]
MPWKSASSSVTGRPKTMVKSKAGGKSIRGQISAPIPVANSLVGEFAEPKQLPVQARDFDPSHRGNSEEPVASANAQSGATTQRVTIDQGASLGAPEGPKRLSKVQTKEPPVRKKSPIRNALGRLFNRRKKTVSQLTTESEPAQRSSAPPQQRGKNENESTSRASGASRSASLPVTEYDRALRSHSVGLDDVLAIQSARNSVAADQTQAKKRSGGSTSPYPLGARYIGDGKLAGLCPRPASANDRDLRRSTLVADDPDEIGRAITSDTSGLKRRSRSMSAMSFFGANQEEHPRRSQEMRNLRESCFYGEDPLSPLSSEFPDDDALGTFNLDLPNVPRPSAPEPTSPEPFMFGNLISDEEAANRQQVEEITLNSRVNGIENRLHVLEDSVSLLRYKANPYAHAGWKPSDATLSTGLGIQTSFSYPNTNVRNPHHSLSMGMAPTSTRPSTGHSEAVFTEPTSHSGGNYTTSQQQSLSEAARPLSEHTLRGQSSHGLLPQRYTSPLGEEQYAAILGLLETERSARIALEAQVQQLTRQLHMLLGGNYPSRAFQKPAAAPPVSAFDYDADESESLGSGSHARYNVWHPQQEQQHGYPHDDSGIDPGTLQQTMTGNEYDDNDDTESTSQLYATPSEEAHASFAVYAKSEHGEDNSSAPRAMSLSRMTMGQIPTAVM